MNRKFDLPSPEKIENAHDAFKALEKLDKEIDRVDQLTNQEKKELSKLLVDMEIRLSTLPTNHYSNHLKGLIEDLKGDLEETGNGLFEIDTYHSFESDETLADSKEIRNKIKMIYLLVVKDEKIRHIALTPDQLKGKERVKIDGYLASVFVFAKQDLDMDFNGLQAATIHGDFSDAVSINLGTHFSVAHFYNLMTPSLGPKELEKMIYTEGVKKHPSERIPGAYFIGKKAHSRKYIGSPISEKERSTIKLLIGSESYELGVDQKIENIQTVDGVEYQYIGSNPEKLKNIPNYEEKLATIVEAIKSVKALFGDEPISKVNIVEYGVENAYANRENKSFSFLLKEFEKASNKEIANTVRHEILHHYTEKLGLTQDEDIKEFFADLWNPQKTNQRKTILKYGSMPSTNPSDIGNCLLFNFIDEVNYFDLETGGHAFENTDEFTTSFLHSLMYIDLLEQNFEGPTNIRFGGQREGIIPPKKHKTRVYGGGIGQKHDYYFSIGQRLLIINQYEKLTKMMIDAVERKDEEPSQKTMLKFLKEKLKHIQKLRVKFDKQ